MHKFENKLGSHWEAQETPIKFINQSQTILSPLTFYIIRLKTCIKINNVNIYYID